MTLFPKRLAGVVAIGLSIAAPLALFSAALAQGYPRVTGSGENYMVDYGPMPGNVVGGGRVMISRADSMNLDVVHIDMMFAQQPRPGYVPLTIGGAGESQETIWVPAAMAQMLRSARTSMPAR